jgi:hypothetical protein
LAIVHMSDQYTRITTGGSPLKPDAPVVGLLFGTPPDESSALEILDAGDISTDMGEPTQQQISLHQAVFPLHTVVGWYRVSPDAEPTADDLATTLRLKQHFLDNDFVFCFTQVGGDVDDLPMVLFHIEESVLVALTDWKLTTSEAEKIAVERVVRHQPAQGSEFCTKVSSMEQALEKMKDRLQTLTSFLQDTESGKVPYDASLMRRVQALVMQLGNLLASQAPPSGVEEWLPHLAIAAKTVQAIQGYTEKVKLVQDHRAVRRF